MTSFNWTLSTTSYDNATVLHADVDDVELADLRQRLEVTRFVVQRVLAPSVIAVGILANVVTVVVLTRRAMALSSTIVYLSVLAVYDALYLALAFTMTWKHYDSLRTTDWYQRYRLPYGRPLTDCASNTAVWLTVTFTVERFIGVWFPMKGKVWCTPRRAVYAVLTVCLAAFLFTLPEFFEFVVVRRSSAGSRSNHSVSQPPQVRLRAELTDFGASPGYQLGYNHVNQSLFTFLPLILLFIFNSLLVKAVLSAARRRQAMTVTVAQRESTRSSDRDVTEQRITVMLISVVVVFLVCQLPQAIQKLYTVYLVSTPGAMTTARQLQLAIGGNFCNLLVIVNSAVNFVLYSALSAKFRQTFLLTFCPCYVRQARRSSATNLTGLGATAAVPLQADTATTAVGEPKRQHRRGRPHTASTDFNHELVNADGQSLLD